MLRIDSYLSNYGICSRRKVKDLIAAKKVIVNDRIISEVIRIDPDKDEILVDGKYIKVKKQNYEYILLNKPTNVLSTTSDDFGRKTVMEYVKSKNRLYPVGRLDYNSSGLILLTNDGDLALKMTHPRYHVPKKYLVTLDKDISDKEIKRLEGGVTVYGERTLPAKIKRISSNKFEIEIRQGLKRQIRMMCKTLDLEVRELHRISIGNIKLGNLKPGACRELTKIELKELQNKLEKEY